MAGETQHMATRLGTMCRDVAVTVIAGIYRSRPIAEINRAVKSRPVSHQALITLMVLGALLGFSLIAAQIGWVAMLLYWFAVIILVN